MKNLVAGVVLGAVMFTAGAVFTASKSNDDVLREVRDRQAIELHPYLQIARVNYAQALEFSGRLSEALAQYKLASVMSPDLPWLRALEGTCLAKMGQKTDAQDILDELEHLRRSEYVDAFHQCVFREALGQRAEAMNELERAVDENSAFLYSMNVDPKVDAFRGDARYQRLEATRSAVIGAVR